MSRLPPPERNRDPLAKSAPSFRAATKRGISAGSFEPSASIITMKSPVAAAKPQARAFPLPPRVWRMTVMSGRRRCATLDGVVRRVSVDDDHFVVLREPRQDVRQVARLVLGRNHDADSGLHVPRHELRPDARHLFGRRLAAHLGKSLPLLPEWSIGSRAGPLFLCCELPAAPLSPPREWRAACPPLCLSLPTCVAPLPTGPTTQGLTTSSPSR